MLERVMVKESNEDPAARGKRTIGILRQFFPSITKVCNNHLSIFIFYFSILMIFHRKFMSICNHKSSIKKIVQ